MNIIFFISFFLLIFAPVLRWLGHWADLLVVTAIVLVGIGMFQGVHFVKKMSIFGIVAIPFLAGAFFFTLSNGSVSIEEVAWCLSKPIRILVTVWACYVLVVLLKRKFPGQYRYKCLLFVWGSVFLHAVIITAQFFFPAFRDACYSAFGNLDFLETRGSWNLETRMGGLTGFYGGASLSVFQSAGIILLPFLFHFMPSKSAIKKALFSLGAVIVAFSISVVGKTGLYLALVLTPLSILLASPPGKRLKPLLIGSLIALGGLGVFSVLFFTDVGGESASRLVKSLGRNLDIFFQDDKSATSDTIKTLLMMWEIPNDASTFLFGDITHLLNRGEGRILNSDVGYVRDLHGLGIFSQIIYYVPFFWLLGNGWRSFARKKSILGALVFVFSLLFFLYLFKECGAYVRSLLSIYGIFAALFIIEREDLQSVRRFERESPRWKGERCGR